MALDEELERHKPLVIWTIKRMGLPPYGDVLGAGLMGLWMALKGYDAARGTQFSTYARRCIWGQVKTQQRRSRGISAKDHATKSLEAVVRDDPVRPVRLADLVEAPPQREPFDAPADFWARVSRYLEPRAAAIVLGRYRDGKVLRELGDEHNLSRQRVQKIIAEALERLRRYTTPETFGA